MPLFIIPSAPYNSKVKKKFFEEKITVVRLINGKGRKDHERKGFGSVTCFLFTPFRPRWLPWNGYRLIFTSSCKDLSF